MLSLIIGTLNEFLVITGEYINQKTASAPAAENKMGTMPIGRLLFNMSLPMMVSMLVQALYNIVDSIFVAKLSENALTAVSLAFPLQMLLIAVATGTGVGMNALLSRALGAKKTDEANKIASNAAFLYIISYIVFLILGFTVVKPFYASQIGNADVEIMEMGIDYLSTVMIFSMGLLAQICFERLLTSTGRTIFSMTSQLCGAITNIILDPILIFGLIGFPKMGVTGAAIATLVSQLLNLLLILIGFAVCLQKEAERPLTVEIWTRWAGVLCLFSEYNGEPDLLFRLAQVERAAIGDGHVQLIERTGGKFRYSLAVLVCDRPQCRIDLC